ncbi:MAG: MBL fold metallo-hydrolase [Candidatus Aenigmarchaeota archaeon]|nr:MBL fold metallo-hydrolase [Candidatus Aenigmarchaeota archaeon]
MHSINIGPEVIWFGHASFMIKGSKNIYIDPHVLPDKTEKADIILVTHEHFDHCNAENIKKLRGEAKVLGPPGVMKKLGFGSPINIDSVKTIEGVKITGTDAYNTNKFRSPGSPFHPRGLGIGYLIEIGGKTIYHAGDTDNIPEMKNLGHVDIALLPIGGTYTMTVEEAAEAAKVIKPTISIPMHYNSDKYGIAGINADPEEFARLAKGVDVKILTPLV